MVHIHYMIETLHLLFKSAGKTCLPHLFYDDVQWWCKFSKMFKGKAEIFTDSSLCVVTGIYSSDFCQG